MADAEALPAVAHSDPAVGVGAAEAERRQLSDSELRGIVEAEVSERSAAAREYERAGRDDLAERLRSDAAVLGTYLSVVP